MNSSIVSFGETLWDLLPTGPELGGAPLNFAYRTTLLGHRTSIISRLGRDDLGDKARNHLAALGMDGTCLQRDDTYPTGIVEVFFDENKNPNYTIIENVAYDYIEFLPNLKTVLADADCLCFGTLAQRNAVSRQTLQHLLSEFSGVFKLLDVNLRKNCYSEATIKSSIKQADVLKLNDEELTALVDVLGLQGESVPDQTEQLLKHADLKYCVVTLGERGAFAHSHQGEKIYSPGYRVRLVDPCGSGDGFAAGFIHALLEGQSLKQACRIGNALGAMVARQAGATQPISFAEILDFMAAGPPGMVDQQLADFLT